MPARTTGRVRSAKLGHHVRLIAPAYVKPFIKRQKNDAADAEAICEAAQRPSMRFVPVKTEEQQANGIVFRARDLLVRQRTQCVNALRGHLLEYGYVFPKGITHVETLVALVEDLQSSLPDSVRVILKLLVDTFTALEAQIAALDAEINQRSKIRPDGTPADDNPRRGANCLDGNHCAGARGRGVSGRARFRGLARTDAAAEIDRRQAKTRCRFETR